MTPHELAAYLDVLRDRAGFSRVVVPIVGDQVLVVDVAPMHEPTATVEKPAPQQHPIIGDLQELGVDVNAMTSTLERLKAPT